MSLTGFRQKLSKNALAGIVIVGLLAIILPVFFSGVGGRNNNVSPEDQRRQEQVADRDKVVARVGQEEVTRGQLDDTLDMYLQGQNASPLMRHQLAPRVVDSLANQAILVQAARQQGIEVKARDIDAEIDKQVKAQAEQKGVYQLASKEEQSQFESQIRGQVEAKRDEIAKGLVVQRLQDNLKKKVSLTSPGIKPADIEVSARHILIAFKGGERAAPTVKRTKAEAKALAEKLTAEVKANPSTFASVADKNTDDPSGKGKGGGMQNPDGSPFYFGQNSGFAKPFLDAAMKAQPGQIIGPVETAFGYHVIKVDDRRVAEARAMQEVQKFLDEQKKSTKTEFVAADLKAAKLEQDAPAPAKDAKAVAAKRQNAIAAYEAAAKERPRDPALFMMLGQLYRDGGNNQKALENYQKAAALPQPSADIHMALGDLYRKMKQKDKALDHYKLAGRLAGSDFMIHSQLRMAYHDLGQKDLAKQQDEWMRNYSSEMMRNQTIPGG